MKEYSHINLLYMNVRVFPCDSPLQVLIQVLSGYSAISRSKSAA